MFAISNEELKAKPRLGDTITCKHCGETHAIEYGTTRQPDGTWVEDKAIAFFRCGDKSYLAGVGGREL